MFLAYARIRASPDLSNTHKCLISVHRRGKRLELSDTCPSGELGKLIRDSEPWWLRAEYLRGMMVISQRESRRLSELRFLGRKRERRRDCSPIRPLRLSRWGPGDAAAVVAAGGKRRQSAGRKIAPAPPDTDR